MNIYLGFVLGVLFGIASIPVHAYVIVVPEEVPYELNGETYTHVIAVLNTSNGKTNHLYCDADVYYGTPDDHWFSWRCGENGQYNHYIIRTFDSNGTKTYDLETQAWGKVTSGGETTSGLSEDTIRTNDPIYDQPNWWEEPKTSIAFDVNFCPDTPLAFPLAGVTPYTAEVSTVMDQSTLGNGAVYSDDTDGQVESFEGEIGDYAKYPGSTCWSKSDSSTFGLSINYTGTYATGGAYYLCYNGHPGYDYPKAQETDIHAPEAGVLCFATSYTSERDPANVWRNTTYCPFPDEVITSWEGYHTFYIFHDELRIDGEIGDYMTVFLHNDDLSSSVRDAIETYGYAEVEKSAVVAEVGGYGLDENGDPSPTACSDHVHMEVYKWNDSTSEWGRVDPYGDGTDGILWEE